MSRTTTSSTLHPCIAYILSHFLPVQSPEKMTYLIFSIIGTSLVFVPQLISYKILLYLSRPINPVCANIILRVSLQYIYKHTCVYLYMFLIKGVKQKYASTLTRVLCHRPLISYILLHIHKPSPHHIKKITSEKTFLILFIIFSDYLSAYILTSSDPKLSRFPVVVIIHSIRTSDQSPA